MRTHFFVKAHIDFIGFLADWQSGSGFAFVTDKGRTVHPFDKYLTSILNAYETSDKEVVSSMQSLYAFPVSLMTLLDSKGDIEKRLPTVNLDLLRRLRTSIRDNAYNASNRAGTWIPDYGRLYVDLFDRTSWSMCDEEAMVTVSRWLVGLGCRPSKRGFDENSKWLLADFWRPRAG
jgi:hypothetical protein